jgi:hypothetical protein
MFGVFCGQIRQSKDKTRSGNVTLATEGNPWKGQLVRKGTGRTK